MTDLKEQLQTYQILLSSLKPHLCERDQLLLEKETAVFEIDHRFVGNVGDAQEADDDTSIDFGPARYLGEASDVRFYNTVKQDLNRRLVIDSSSLEYGEIEISTYEQNGKQQQSSSTHENGEMWPDHTTADHYLEIYFTTIYIAYPYLDRSLVEKRHDDWWQTRSTENHTSSLDGLLCR